MSLLRECSLYIKSIERISPWCNKIHPSLQLLTCDWPQLKQSAGLKKQTNRFKLPPVPKEKERKIYKKKKIQDSISSIPAHFISDTPSPDDVWSRRYFPTPEFTFLEGIKMHREYAHPDMTDNEDGVVFVQMTLDMTTSKKTKFLPAPQGLVLLPNNFDNFFPNRIIAITKSNEEQAIAEKAGAIFIGGQELIKKLEKGELKAEDYDHVVMSESMLLEASVIKKVLKDHFPSRKDGSLGTDMHYMVQLFRVGKEYQATKVSDVEATMNFAFGKLNMSDEELVQNIRTILNTVAAIKPYGKLFKQLSITVPPSKESFVISDESIMPAKPEVDMKAINKRKSKSKSEDAEAPLEAVAGEM